MAVSRAATDRPGCGVLLAWLAASLAAPGARSAAGEPKKPPQPGNRDQPPSGMIAQALRASVRRRAVTGGTQALRVCTPTACPVTANGRTSPQATGAPVAGWLPAGGLTVYLHASRLHKSGFITYKSSLLVQTVWKQLGQSPNNWIYSTRILVVMYLEVLWLFTTTL